MYKGLQEYLKKQNELNLTSMQQFEITTETLTRCIEVMPGAIEKMIKLQRHMGLPKKSIDDVLSYKKQVLEAMKIVIKDLKEVMAVGAIYEKNK